MKFDIVRLSYQIEYEDLQLTGGKQDQYVTAFVGFNFMEVAKNKN